MGPGLVVFQSICSKLKTLLIFIEIFLKVFLGVDGSGISFLGLMAVLPTESVLSSVTL